MAGDRAEDTPAGTDEFVALRPLLFSLAYRMTGSVADAEDIVSESYLRLRRAQSGGTRIDSLKTYAVVGGHTLEHRSSSLGADAA